MSWNDIRKPYEERIKLISKSIDNQLEKWIKTGNYAHYKFAQDEIKHLKDLKDYILSEEKKRDDSDQK